MKECRYMTGTVVENSEWSTGAKDGSLAVRLDGPGGTETLFAFDYILAPDNPKFPFDVGDRIEVIIRTIEE